MSSKLPMVVVFFVFALQDSQQAVAEDKNFKNLYDCYSAIRGTSELCMTCRDKNFHLVHAQRFTDKSTSSPLALTGSDSFLVFNKTGAIVMNPKSESYKLERAFGGRHQVEHRNQKSYFMTFTLPGEPQSTRFSYFVDEKKELHDQAGSFVEESSSYNKKFVKHEGDPLKPVLFSDALTLIINPMEKLIKKYENLDLENFLDAQIRQPGNSKRKRMISPERLANSKNSISNSLELLKACEKLGNGTIDVLAERRRVILERMRSLLTEMNTTEESAGRLRPVSGAK